MHIQSMLRNRIVAKPPRHPEVEVVAFWSSVVCSAGTATTLQARSMVLHRGCVLQLDVVPLEEVLQDLRDTALKHQVDISAMVKKWHDMEPMPSDPHQPPATVDVQNISAGYMASLVAKIDDVKQSRRTRFVEGMVAVQALWARGLSGAGNWHENRCGPVSFAD